MGFLEDEFEEVRKLCHNRVADSKLTTCTNGLVRVEIKKTVIKSMIAVLQFPTGYPSVPLIVELRSKTLSDNLLSGLTQVCEEEAKKCLGKPQILKTLEFLASFLEANPLCCCSEEISRIKRELLLKDADDIKLKQKISTISLTLREALYVHRVHIVVPNDYPSSQVKFETVESNFPGNFSRFFHAQATELARRCVEAPLNKKNAISPLGFQARPSLHSPACFLVQQVRRYPTEKCSICRNRCFPESPSDVIQDENHNLHVERIFCGHI